MKGRVAADVAGGPDGRIADLFAATVWRALRLRLALAQIVIYRADRWTGDAV